MTSSTEDQEEHLQEMNIPVQAAEGGIDAANSNQGNLTSAQGGLSGIDSTETTERLAMLSISTPDCEVCRFLLKAFAVVEDDGHNRPNKLSLGSCEAAMATDCEAHKPLIDEFVSHCRKFQEEDPSRDLGGIELTCTDGSSKARISMSISRMTQNWSLVLAKSPSDPDHVGKGRILDAEHVDMDMIKHWMADCLTHHGAKCSNPMKIWPTSPAWLVDVEQKCVVPGHIDMPFIALSYRWGMQAGVSVTPEILEDLQQPEALNDPRFSEYMTTMVQHAIYLTSALGMRYLWIDTLCIAHGDPGTAAQLGLMGAIFASSTVTIIAADSCVEDGIAGLGIPGSARRDHKQRVLPFGKEKIIVRGISPFLLLGGTPYYSRGWTFQENRLAKRKIFFKDGQAHWECQCRVWHEDLTVGTEIGTYLEPRLREMLAGFPNLSSLSNIIGRYNELEFRYEEDALPGVTGLLAVLSRSFRGGFLYGLPEMFLDAALGWRPFWPFTELTRRVKSDRPEHLQVLKAPLPSWSWVGWKGLVDIGSEAARINHRSYEITETFPVTKWFTAISPTDEQLARRPIRPLWYENRDQWKQDAAHAMPAGWTRHKLETDKSSFRDEPLLWPDGCDEYVYKHGNLPDDDWGPTNTFYYPFPVQGISEATPPDMPEQTAFLFCKTRGANLWTKGDEVDDERFPGGGTLVVRLNNELGDCVGKLQLHNHAQHAQLMAASEGRELGAMVEVVAINAERSYKLTWKEEKSGGDTLFKFMIAIRFCG